MACLDPLQSGHVPQGLHNHRLIEEDDGVQCLGLGRSSHFADDRQIIEERFHLRGPQFPRVALAMEEDVLPDPVAITLFGAGAEMAATADGREQVEQTRGAGYPITLTPLALKKSEG